MNHLNGAFQATDEMLFLLIISTLRSTANVCHIRKTEE